jgi:hypothetical protein
MTPAQRREVEARTRAAEDELLTSLDALPRWRRWLFLKMNPDVEGLLLLIRLRRGQTV